MRRSLPGFSLGSLLVLVGITGCTLLANRQPWSTAAGPGVSAPTPEHAARPVAPPVTALLPAAAHLGMGSAQGAARLPLGPIGSDGPLVFEAAAPNGSWVAYCQARSDTDGDGTVVVQLSTAGSLSGDQLVHYFAFGAHERGPAELRAAHPSGRWVVLREGDTTLLLDLSRLREVNLEALGADTAPDGAVFLPQRSLVFHPVRPLFAYVKKSAQGLIAVLRNLETDHELSVPLGSGELVRLEFSQTGDALISRMLVADTNKNGRLDLPIPLRKGPASCQKFAPIPTFPAWLDPGDEVVASVAALTFEPELRAAPALVVPGFIAATSRGFLVREDSSLWLEQAGGRTLVAPKACGGVVWHVDPMRGDIVFACARDNPVALSRLQLFTAGTVSDLGVELRPLGPDRWRPPSRLVPFYPGALTALLDMDKKALLALQPDDAVIATKGQRALIWRGRKLLRFDAETGLTHDYNLEVDAMPFVIQADGIAAVSPYVIDLERETPLGRITQRPLAVAADGHVLVAMGQQASADGLATGPLVWVEPH